MEIHPVSAESLNKAADILLSGGLVAFPTETVYGLGADAYNSGALVKIFEAKNRPFFDPLIIHIAAIETLEEVADLSVLDEKTRYRLFLLAENLWPGPLSIILPKSGKIPGVATAGLSTAAVRFPSHETALNLISLSSGAVAAPSANPFGSLSPTRAEHVRDSLGEKADMILDGGPALIGVESTVLDITGKEIKILRHGGTPKESIESCIGKVFCEDSCEVDTKKSLVSPGQLKSHYAPKTPLLVFSMEDILSLPCKKGTAWLFFDNSSRDSWLKERSAHDIHTSVLSACGNVSEAASRLFETLHELDKSGFSGIYAQLAPQEGLGQAINDRLLRACESFK
jgi:L-threonylcarbamoyladenylate synthase